MTSQFISKNRNPCSQFFVTFPHSTVDKIQFRDVFSPDQVNWYMIAEEKHKDGSPHLHAIIKMKSKISKSKMLKIYKEKYPTDYKRIDVGPVRSIKNAIKYLGKEDQSPLVSGPYREARNPTKNFLTKFVKENYGFSTLEEFYEDLEKENIQRDNMEQLLWKTQIRKLKINPDGYYNFVDNLEFQKRKKWKKFLSNIPIPKDDMTFFIKSLKDIL